MVDNLRYQYCASMMTPSSPPSVLASEAVLSLNKAATANGTSSPTGPQPAVSPYNMVEGDYIDHWNYAAAAVAALQHGHGLPAAVIPSFQPPYQVIDSAAGTSQAPFVQQTQALTQQQYEAPSEHQKDQHQALPLQPQVLQLLKKPVTAVPVQPQTNLQASFMPYGPLRAVQPSQPQQTLHHQTHKVHPTAFGMFSSSQPAMTFVPSLYPYLMGLQVPLFEPSPYDAEIPELKRELEHELKLLKKSGDFGEKFKQTRRILSAEVRKLYTRTDPEWLEVDIFKPVRISKKILVPTYRYSNFNVMDKLMAPGDATLQTLAKQFGCQIYVCGRDWTKRGVKEPEMIVTGANQEGPLHVKVECFASPPLAYAQIGAVIDKLTQLLKPRPDPYAVAVRKRGMELALNSAVGGPIRHHTQGLGAMMMARASGVGRETAQILHGRQADQGDENTKGFALGAPVPSSALSPANPKPSTSNTEPSGYEKLKCLDDMIF